MCDSHGCFSSHLTLPVSFLVLGHHRIEDLYYCSMLSLLPKMTFLEKLGSPHIYHKERSVGCEREFMLSADTVNHAEQSREQTPISYQLLKFDYCDFMNASVP